MTNANTVCDLINKICDEKHRDVSMNTIVICLSLGKAMAALQEMTKVPVNQPEKTRLEDIRNRVLSEIQDMLEASTHFSKQ